MSNNRQTLWLWPAKRTTCLQRDVSNGNCVSQLSQLENHKAWETATLAPVKHFISHISTWRENMSTNNADWLCDNTCDNGGDSLTKHPTATKDVANVLGSLKNNTFMGGKKQGALIKSWLFNCSLLSVSLNDSPRCHVTFTADLSDPQYLTCWPPAHKEKKSINPIRYGRRELSRWRHIRSH